MLIYNRAYPTFVDSRRGASCGTRQISCVLHSAKPTRRKYMFLTQLWKNMAAVFLTLELIYFHKVLAELRTVTAGQNRKQGWVKKFPCLGSPFLRLQCFIAADNCAETELCFFCNWWVTESNRPSWHTCKRSTTTDRSSLMRGLFSKMKTWLAGKSHICDLCLSRCN